MTGHGGKRAGAGRRPRALRFAGAVAASESEIASNLLALTRKLVHRALVDGDVKACTYLLDRMMGRPAMTAVVAAEDLRYPPIPGKALIRALEDVVRLGGPTFAHQFVAIVKSMEDPAGNITPTPISAPQGFGPAGLSCASTVT